MSPRRRGYRNSVDVANVGICTEEAGNNNIIHSDMSDIQAG